MLPRFSRNDVAHNLVTRAELRCELCPGNSSLSVSGSDSQNDLVSERGEVGFLTAGMAALGNLVCGVDGWRSEEEVGYRNTARRVTMVQHVNVIVE